MKVGKPYKIKHRRVAEGGCGDRYCVIFRPMGLRARVGNRVLVEIRVQGLRPSLLSYVVEFCAAAGS